MEYPGADQVGGEEAVQLVRAVAVAKEEEGEHAADVRHARDLEKRQKHLCS